MVATVEVLGCAQDGGIPHVGCECDRCSQARTNPEKQRYASAIELISETEERYLFDATPDVRFQITTVPDGVFLSHAHLGHLPGVLHFGTEVADTANIPIYCTSGMADLIRGNAPFTLLLERDNITIERIEDSTQVDICDTTVTPRAVTHREAFPTGTVSFVLEGSERTLYYVSDIDRWTKNAKRLISEADIALIDGTFWSRTDIDRFDAVPHPAIRESLDELDDIDTEVYFTHFDHTNPVLRETSSERQKLEERGFHLVERGMTFEI